MDVHSVNGCVLHAGRLLLRVPKRRGGDQPITSGKHHEDAPPNHVADTHSVVDESTVGIIV